MMLHPRTGSATDATAYVEGFVNAVEPGLVNRAQAYNLWNILATDDGAMRQALEWAWRLRDDHRARQERGNDTTDD